jgi:hypothetical protein
MPVQQTPEAPNERQVRRMQTAYSVKTSAQRLKAKLTVPAPTGLEGCETLGIPHCLDQCCPTFLCTRAPLTDAYGGAGATTLLLLHF